MQDNVKETQATIIDLIVSHSTSAHLKHVPSESCCITANYVQDISDNVDNCVNTAESAISINIDPISYDADPVMDEQGNEWQQMHVTTHISWPSYSNNPAVASVKRARLMLEVSELAQQITERCARPTWKLHRTAEQVKEYDARLAQKRLVTTATMIIERSMHDGVLSGMRVGAVRIVKDDLVEKLTCTSMQVVWATGKTYVVERDETIPMLATITRTT